MSDSEQTLSQEEVIKMKIRTEYGYLKCDICNSINFCIDRVGGIGEPEIFKCKTCNEKYTLRELRKANEISTDKEIMLLLFIED